MPPIKNLVKISGKRMLYLVFSACQEMDKI